MKTENQAKKLEKQGRGLTIFLKILGVILLLLNLLLLDQEFVPWGKTWEEIKQEYPEDVAGRSDKELWTTVKDVMIEREIVPFRSGFLCWGVTLYQWNKQKAKEAERERLLTECDENLRTAMTVVNEFIADYGISADSLGVIQLRLHGNRAMTCSYTDGRQGGFGDFLTAEEECTLNERFAEAFTDVFMKNKEETAAAYLYIFGEKCTAAAFAFRANNLEEGTDYPYLDENGHFDTKQIWGYGWSEVHMHGFLIQYIDEVMLAESEKANETNQE